MAISTVAISRTAILTSLLLPIPAPLFAQTVPTAADLYAIVIDDVSGDPIPDAHVTVTDLAKQVAHQCRTEIQGRCSLLALQPSNYRIEVASPGFANATFDGVALIVGQSVEIVFRLVQPTVISVMPDSPLIEGHGAGIAWVVRPDQIDDLPISGRNFPSLAALTPGVTSDRVPLQGASYTSGLSFSGQRGRSNNILVDGLDNNDRESGAIRAPLSLDAIQEFQVLANSYAAEFGNAAGGVVNIVTRSGANDFHGSAFLYLRDDALNSKEYFERFDVFGNPIARDKAPYRQSQYGATLGGPLRKNQTFFFLSMERNDARASNFVNIDPDAAALLDAAGFPVELGAVPYVVKGLQLFARLDHSWNPTSRLVVRGDFTDTTNQNVEPFGGIVAKSRGAEQLAQDRSLAVSQTDVIGGRAVNEARLLVSVFDSDLRGLDPTCQGPCDGNLEGGPAVDLVGVASVGRQRFVPRPRRTHQFQFTEAVSHALDSHLWKAGFDVGYAHVEQAFPANLGGRYIFAPLPAIEGLTSSPISVAQAFALGLPATYIQGYGDPSGSYGFVDLSFFVQDEWKVGSHLLVKPGIRYQRRFWPEVAYDVSDVSGNRFRYAFPEDGNNIAPRIAATFRPSADGRTSIRVGYGVFFDSLIQLITSVTDVVDGGPDGIRTRVLGLPGTIAAWQAPGHRLPEPTSSYPSVQFAVSPDLNDPLTHQFHVGADHRLKNDLSISADFVYVRGKGQLGTLDYNPIVPSLGPRRRPNDVAGQAGTSASILQYTDFGESWYRGLTLSVNKRFSKGSQFLAFYTLSKAEDNSTDFQSFFIPEDTGQGRNPADPTGLPLGFDPDAENGPSIQDQRHRFVFSGIQRFPHDIQLSTIVTVASGRPYTPLAGFDWNGDGDGGAFPSDRARRTPGPIPSEPTDSVGRNSETTEKQVIVDARLSKRFKIGNDVSLEAIVEAFNLLNRVNFSEINNVFGAGSFPDEPQTDAQGRVTYGLYQGALPPRQVQLALKVSF